MELAYTVSESWYQKEEIAKVCTIVRQSTVSGENVRCHGSVGDGILSAIPSPRVET